MTKCGRYGLNQSQFDYSPATIRNSVERSLERFHTTYLDTVYLHDVEYVCTPVGPVEAGNPEIALFEKTAEYGLAEGQEGKVWGEGDQKILDAYAELRKLQEEGKIKHIGMTGENTPVEVAHSYSRYSKPFRSQGTHSRSFSASRFSCSTRRHTNPWTSSSRTATFP